MFRRRPEATFLHSRSDLRAIYAAAAQGAGSGGTDSLDLLTAVVGAPTVQKLIRRLGSDPAMVAASASEVRVAREPDPGLTADAKRVVEAVAHRAVERRRDPSGLDLLAALVATATVAQGVLAAHGIEETRLRPLIE